jgi:homoserine O-acetyltransferase
MALLNYRSPAELNGRFQRTWQSEINPLGGEGKFAVESYLDFHGNKFSRRFDTNSYLTLIAAMSSHDVGRSRGSVPEALSKVRALTLILGIDSDRLFPLADQHLLARHITTSISGPDPVVIESPFGHDGFLIEHAAVGRSLERLLAADA